MLSFGTSGLLYADNLVMYDRQTESLWPQLTFTAPVGVLTGTPLTPHVLQTVSWAEFRAAHPQAWVLSRDTGFDRDYGRNPYVGYDDPQRPLLFPLPQEDRRERLKERVIGLGVGQPGDVAGAQESRLVDGRDAVGWRPSGADLAGVDQPRREGRIAHVVQR